jgi:prolyl oligopeptidase
MESQRSEALDGDYYSTRMIGDRIFQIFYPASNARGVLRSSSVERFVTGKPDWDSLLDLGVLPADYGSLIVQKIECDPEARRCMLPFARTSSLLSWREFDTREKGFVKGGFETPPMTGWLLFKDKDRLLINSTLIGPQDRSGQALSYNVWRRGEPLDRAAPLLLVKPDPRLGTFAAAQNVYVSVKGKLYRRALITVDRGRETRFEYWLEGGKGQFEQLVALQDCRLFGILGDEIIFRSDRARRTDRGIARPGSLLSVTLSDAKRRSAPLKLLRQPGPREAKTNLVATLRGAILVNIQTDAISHLYKFARSRAGWRQVEVPIPENSVVSPIIISDPTQDIAIAAFENLLQPPTQVAIGPGSSPRILYRQKPLFRTAGLAVVQMHARSADGTMVPYFLVRPERFAPSGSAPTLVTGYGASAVPFAPTYDPMVGRLWLERGGLYVIANVRGGGELGPRWEAIRTERRRVYEDFEAVLRDLVARRISSPEHLGIIGESAGGLLVGVTLTRHPELIHAAVMSVPLLDLFRFDLIGAGPSSYAAEFGYESDPRDRAFMAATSPFENLTARVSTPFFIKTSANDDNVFPAQPRRFAAKAEELKLPYYFFETSGGGHGMGGSTSEETAKSWALVYSFLWRQLGLPKANSVSKETR